MSRRRALVSWLAGASVLAGLAISAFALFILRAPIPEQAETVIFPSQDTPPSQPSESAPVETAPPEEVMPAPTESELVIRYPRNYEVGEEIGTITLSSLELSWPIFQGTEEAQLAKGVGHYLGSVLPGVKDNSILSGHRTTVFNRLGELEVRDLILVETEIGIFTYRVREFRVVDRADQTVIAPTPTAVLTLTTCYPFNSPVRTTQAFLVEADLIRTALKGSEP